MAWQLIYTSAPRLLEAGRSGFGTVARHRQINSLLVAAIERFSQFSRLPGLDPARVVYSHRIVTVGGGRFHVLSCVRDAGADYTGRTNHLAHHVILDPREAAALGRNGPSAADVLLAIPWCQHWDEAPAWLEADQEIDLAQISSQSSPANRAWAQVTGDPAAAWLLATGDASRSACLLTPAGLDLRPLYAESLRLTPESLWQVTFITSLQPSDELGDFRWLGVEAGSDLAVGVSSGRPVLDLTAPHTLRIVEGTPAVTATAPAAVPVAIAPAVVSTSEVPAPPLVPPIVREGRYAIPKATPPVPIDDPFGDFKPTTRKGRNPLLLGGAILAVLAVAIVGTLTYRTLAQGSAGRREIVATLRTANYFDNDVAAQELTAALKGLPRDHAPQVRKLVDAATQLTSHLSEPHFDELRKTPAMPRLRELAAQAGINLPPAMAALAFELDEAAVWQAKFAAFDPSSADEQTFEQQLSTYGEFQRNRLLAPAFALLKKRLSTLALGRQIDALRRMLDGTAEPKGGITWLRATLAKIPVTDLDAAGQAQRRQIEDTLANWSAVQNDSPAVVKQRLASPAAAEWAPWLKRLARIGTLDRPGAIAVGTVEKPAAAVSREKRGPAVIYFARDNAGLEKLAIKELSDDLSFEVTIGLAPPVKLPFKNSGRIRRDVNAQNDGFVMENQMLKCEPQGPKPPYKFVARDSATQVEVFSVFVGSAELGKPTLGSSDAILELASPGIVKLPIKLPKLGDSGAALFLQMPTNAEGENAFSLPAQADGGFNLAPAVSAARAQQATHRANANELSRKASEILKTGESVDSLRKQLDLYAASIKNVEARKVRNPGAKTGAELVGEFAMATATELETVKSGGKADFEQLRAAAKSLADAQGNETKAKSLNAELLTLVGNLEKQLRTNSYDAGLRNIRSACQRLNALLGDKEGLEAEAKAWQKQAEAEELKAKQLESLPLLSGKIPPGEYSLNCRLSDGSTIRLYRFRQPQP